MFEVTSGGTLTLTDCGSTGKVTRAYNNPGGGVKVENGGIFNMYGGTITKNTATLQGGGVCVTGARSTFNMYGGAITDNTASHGGGVYVSGGKFTMNGNASVTKNKTDNSQTSSGAGVYVDGGTFTMKDGTISGNNATNSPDGGVGVYNSSTFTMDGGTITGNTASQGGGVGVYQTAKFEMNNTASVSGNTAKNGGGVYVSVSGKGTFNMNDNASVTRNTASGDKADQGNGGGVFVNSGTFEMNGSASVSNNTATNTKMGETTYGGGVYVKSGTFTMNGEATSVSNNTATNGGGVYASGGTFAMNGNSKVTNNIGNGVFVNGGKFTVSGTPTVTENTKGSTDSNVHLAANAYITIGNFDLNGSENSIGVTKTTDKGVFAKGVSTDYSGKFFSDNTQYKVEYDKTDKDNHKLVLTRTAGTHTHSWTYTIKEGTTNTIVATCANTDTPCNNTNGGSVTITAPEHKTYGDGKSAKAQLRKANWQGEDVEKITYSTQGDTALDTAPTEVGKYKASITVDDKTAFVEYEITDGSTPAKREQDPLKLTVSKDTIAVGETLILSVDGGSTKGAVTYRITGETGKATIKGNVLIAEKAGKVTVTATMAGNETYNDVTSEPLTITITEKSGGGTTGGSTGGGSSSGGSSSGGSSSGGSGSSDSNPIIKTETKNNSDGSTTKIETRKDGSVTATTTGKDGSVSKTETKKDGSSVTENTVPNGSVGTVKTDKNGKTEMNAKLSAKAVEDAKKSGEPVKAPVEVESSRNSGTAPTVKVELPKNAGKTEVEIPVSNAKPGTVAVLVHADGTEEILKASVSTEGGIRLTVDGSATVKIVDNSKDFIDTRNHWAKDAIDFVSARELVNGMSDSIYAPNNSTTRAQLWTILARQNDADLNGGNTWYEKAQLWSQNKGISDGTRPNAAINRAQMVTMMWRTAGQPTAGGTANFTDVPADSYYASAVAWAVENGITDGVGNGRFDPAATCTRAQIATFLARSMK